MKKNMDNLELLSDDELRTRLLQYGFKNVPITESTRQVLIKRLRNCMENEKVKLKRATTNATRYSSGEESDSENAKKYKSFSGATTTSTTNQSRNFQSYQMPPPPAPPITRRTTTTSSIERRSSPTSNIYISPTITSEMMDDDENNGGYEMSMDTSRLSHNDSPGNSNIRNRYSNISTTASNGHKSEDSPYFSDFTKRLLSFRGDTVKTGLNNKSPQQQPPSSSSMINDQSLYRPRSSFIPSDREIVHQAPYKPSKYISSSFASPPIRDRSNNTVPVNIAFKNLLKKLDDYKQPVVPCILVSVFIIFFAVVVLMYLTISPDIVSNLNPKDTNFIKCTTNDIIYHNNDLSSSLQCINSNDLDSALFILKIIVPELQNRAIKKYCKNTETISSITQDEIISLVLKLKPNYEIKKIINDIKNVAYLVEMNTQWRISNVDSNGIVIMNKNNNNKINSFAILEPKLPFTCIIKNKFQKFFLTVGVIAIIVILIYGLRFTIKTIIYIRQSRKELLESLINEILSSAAETSTKDSGNQVIVLNHLRDKLIIPSKRKEMEWAWCEAIKYLEFNDSRLQFEIRNINGEDCKAIKWINTITKNSIANISTVKRWQSPAFDKTNKIIDPPTPCLKIRQMFDKFEANDPNLKTIIQNSILEKVGNDCKIYDVQLDTKTCCVYVKCSSARDAGMVHDEINGWWFDNRLVSIKFVRLERYNDRFPKSASGPTCLRPSNTKNLSMSPPDPSFNNHEEDDDDDDDLDDDGN